MLKINSFDACLYYEIFDMEFTIEFGETIQYLFSSFRVRSNIE
jgi:hypothetical protein